MITFDLYRSRDERAWHAVMPGASGSGATPWEAIREALTVWDRRGRPTDAPDGVRRGGADWVIDHAVDRGPGHFYRYHVRGVNLNSPPDGYGRAIHWDVPSIDDPRYEFLPGAWAGVGREAAVMSAPSIGIRWRVYQVREAMADRQVGTVVALDADGARRKAYLTFGSGRTAPVGDRAARGFAIGFSLRCERWCDVRPGAHTSAAECAPYLLPDHGCGVCGVSHANPCPTCAATGFHADGCPERDA